MTGVEEIKKHFYEQLGQADSSTSLDAIKIKMLGRKGPVQALLQELRTLPSEKRRQHGKKINDLKLEISEKIHCQQEIFFKQEEEERLKKECLDITLPGRAHFQGRKHILTQTVDHMIDILEGMGFSVQYGPDIETEYYNFEALNFPKDHPARDMQDTFYIAKDVLLRTHTSNIQTRVMEANKPPLRIIAPGKVYRNEAITARSHVFFQQVEALAIDEGVTFADLLATMDEFLKKLFKKNVEMRYRPSYFPFVEPGIEVDIRCLSCQGTGCTICKHTGWLEIAGAGMVHPEVLKNGDIDPEKYSGFAWGIGVERLVMLKYGVTDIRLFTENHQRFLQQFSFI